VRGKSSSGLRLVRKNRKLDEAWGKRGVVSLIEGGLYAAKGKGILVASDYEGNEAYWNVLLSAKRVWKWGRKGKNVCPPCDWREREGICRLRRKDPSKMMGVSQSKIKKE